MRSVLHTRRLMKRGLLFSARLGLICTFLFLTVSCYERIDVDLSTQPPVLVVTGGITTDSVCHYVRLSRSISYFDTSLHSIPVSDARVEVWEDNQIVFPFIESDTEAGFYYSPTAFVGKPGANYRVEIEARVTPSSPSLHYSAQETMPQQIYIDSVGSCYGKQRLNFKPGHGWSVLLYATDPPEKNYYGMSVYVDGKNYNDSIRFLTLIDDIVGNGMHLNGIPVIFFRSGKPKKMPVHAGCVITVKVASFTQGYFQWINDIQTSLKPTIPVFSGVPSNCRGNISNGAFGYFFVYAIARDSTTLSERDSIAWSRHHH